MKKNYIQWMCMGVLGVTVLLTGQACTEEWDDHYDKQPNNLGETSTLTLWENIQNQAELANFAKLCEKAGYDSILGKTSSGSMQSYTVWAPVLSDAEFERYNQMETAQMERELLQNHIARTKYIASGNVSKNILLLNKKTADFETVSEQFTFGGIEIQKDNVSSLNGMLYQLSGVYQFLPNLWEKMDSDDNFSELSTYLHSFDDYVIDVENSVVGNKVNGQQTYFDSVMINNNEKFREMGYFEREDSSYTMVLYTNKAWQEAIELMTPYFDYERAKGVAEGVRDSLRDANIKQFIVRNTVYNNNLQPMPEVDITEKDSIISTSAYYYDNSGRESYYMKPEQYAGYFSGAIREKVSNGEVFIKDEFTIKPEDGWFQPIVIEAESPQGRVVNQNSMMPNTYSVTSLTKNPKVSGSISDNRYMEMGVNGNTAPQLSFWLPNVLKGSYRVKVVLVPANIRIQDSLVVARPTQMRFELKSGIPTDGSSTSQETTIKNVNLRGNVNLEESEYDYTKVDTVTIQWGRNEEDQIIAFDHCVYGLNSENSSRYSLSVRNMASASNPAYERNLRIDCIILEPVLDTASDKE